MRKRNSQSRIIQNSSSLIGRLPPPPDLLVDGHFFLSVVVETLPEIDGWG